MNNTCFTSLESLPAMLIGSRIIVPKERLLTWIDDKLARNELAI